MYVNVFDPVPATVELKVVPVTPGPEYSPVPPEGVPEPWVSVTLVPKETDDRGAKVTVGVALTVKLTACIFVQPLAFAIVIVPEYVPAAVPAGTTMVLIVPPPSAKAKDVFV